MYLPCNHKFLFTDYATNTKVFEIMLDRKLLIDDGKGIGEVLTQTDVVKSEFLLRIETPRIEVF